MSKKPHRSSEQKDSDYLRRFALIAIFSDDNLMEQLVFKGGSSLRIIYRLSHRSSVDLDFSIENTFNPEELHHLGATIEGVLSHTFFDKGYVVFDFKIEQRPPKLSQDMAAFWGGHKVYFKLIEVSKYERYKENIEQLRRNATVIGEEQRKTFTIDISHFEYCKEKQAAEIDGYTIYVYTPIMIVFEKLRAICQQMPEYAEFVKNPSQSPRARDFFDIYIILEHFHLALDEPLNLDLLRNIFHAKRVPLEFIGKINNYRDYHRIDFDSVKNSITPNFDLKSFDFYCDYVVEKCACLKSLWEKQAP